MALGLFPLRQRRLIRGRLIASLGFPLRGETLVKAGSERSWRDVAVAILAASAAAYSQCGNSNDENLHSSMHHLCCAFICTNPQINCNWSKLGTDMRLHCTCPLECGVRSSSRKRD